MGPSRRSVPFDRIWDRTAFSCGVEILDRWLREYAGQAEERHNARTFLLVDEPTKRVLGYYTLVAYRLELDEVGAALGVERRRYPMSAILLARLAVDTTVQKQGLGGVLLDDALRRIAGASESIGFETVVVDAIDDRAAVFYRYFGFTPFADCPNRLFMTTKDLLATLAAV